jgi:hypothetical protein
VIGRAGAPNFKERRLPSRRVKMDGCPSRPSLWQSAGLLSAGLFTVIVV